MQLCQVKTEKMQDSPCTLWGAHPGQLGVSLGFQLLSGSIAVIMRGGALLSTYIVLLPGPSWQSPDGETGYANSLLPVPEWEQDLCGEKSAHHTPAPPLSSEALALLLVS